jgi:hypothetical protein
MGSSPLNALPNFIHNHITPSQAQDMLTNANTGRMIHTINQNAQLMAQGVLPEEVGTSQNLEASRLFLRASQPGLDQGARTPKDQTASDSKPTKRTVDTKRGQKYSPSGEGTPDKTPVDEDSMKNDTIYKDDAEMHKTNSSQRKSKNISVCDQSRPARQKAVAGAGARSNAAVGHRSGVASLPADGTVYVEEKEEHNLDERSSNATPSSPARDVINTAAYDYLDRSIGAAISLQPSIRHDAADVQRGQVNVLSLEEASHGRNMADLKDVPTFRARDGRRRGAKQVPLEMSTRESDIKRRERSIQF